jgi:hypothetical protein
MSNQTKAIPAATGTIFAVVLTLANGQGGTLSDARDVAASAALTILIPFVVYVGIRVATEAVTDADRWLACTAMAAGTAGAAIKLISGAPEIALAHTDPSDTTTTHVLTAMADSLTLLALFPLAAFCLAAGLGALRTGVLPAWLSVCALVVGLSLAVNGSFRGTENVPALLLMALWCLVASIYLTVSAFRGKATRIPSTTTSVA